MFPFQTVWSSVDMLGVCLHDTGYHYSFTLDLVSVLWLQETSANWCEQKWKFWLLVKSRQKALQWLIRQTDWNRALCYETCFIWNAFSMGIGGNELQTQKLRMSCCCRELCSILSRVFQSILGDAGSQLRTENVTSCSYTETACGFSHRKRVNLLIIFLSQANFPEHIHLDLTINW